MQPVELVGGGLVLEDSDATRVGADDDVVCAPSLLARFSSQQRVLDTFFFSHRPRRDALTLCRFQNITKLQRQKKKRERTTEP